MEDIIYTKMAWLIRQVTEEGKQDMKRARLFLSLLVILLVLAGIPVWGTAGEPFCETVLDRTISSDTAARTINLRGYQEFIVLARLKGPARSQVQLKISFNHVTMIEEQIVIDADGGTNFAKSYPVYAPRVHLTLTNPPAKLQAKVMVYAAK